MCPLHPTLGMVLGVGLRVRDVNLSSIHSSLPIDHAQTALLNAASFLLLDVSALHMTDFLKGSASLAFQHTLERCTREQNSSDRLGAYGPCLHEIGS